MIKVFKSRITADDDPLQPACRLFQSLNTPARNYDQKTRGAFSTFSFAAVGESSTLGGAMNASPSRSTPVLPELYEDPCGAI